MYHYQGGQNRETC